MSREILFRGFHECENGTQIAVVNGKEHKGKWEFGYYWTNEAGDHFIKVIRDLNGNFVGNPTTNDYEVFPETVCEFTGLTDRNGKKIFEGDILHINVESEAISKEHRNDRYVIDRVVAFKEGQFCLDGNGLYLFTYYGIKFLDKAGSFKNYEVIGTIFDKED